MRKQRLTGLVAILCSRLSFGDGRTKTQCTALLLALVTPLCACQSVTGADAVTHDKAATDFVRTYREHLSKLQEAVANVQCDFEFSKLRPDGTTETLDGTMFAKGESLQYIQSNASPSEENGLVLSASPAIRFQLRRSLKDQPYQVAKVNRSAHAADDAPIRNGLALNAEPFVNAAFHISDISIPAALADANATVAVSPITREGHEYIELRLRFPESKTDRSAWAILDPALEFSVREYELEFTIPGGSGVRIVRKGEVECDRQADGFVVPKRIHMQSLKEASEKQVVTGTSTLEFVRIKRGDVTDRQFTLEAFGIEGPDLGRTPTRRLYPLDRWYFWMLLFIAVAAWLYVRRVRKGGSEGARTAD